MAALLGLFGIFSISFVLIMRILTMKSFDTDYTLGLRVANCQSLKDTVVRAPWTRMITRPFFNSNIIRSRREREC